MSDTLVFPLDGSRRDTTSLVSTPSGVKSTPTTLRGWRRANGDLDLEMTKQIPWGSDVALQTTTEKWRLWKDGALWIRFHREDPIFSTDYDMRFTRIGLKN